MLARAAIVLNALLFACVPLSWASAQDVDRIAAVVNDEIISIRDLDARLKLAITVSGLPDNIESRRRAVPQVLRKMVDERIQAQEAARLKVSAGTEDVARGLANVENQNRMPPGSLLTSLAKAGVDPDAVKDQIRADIIWVKLIMRSLQPTIKVGEDEITERLETIRQQFGQPEFMLAEIFLPVDSPRQEEESKRLGERLIEQLRAGAPFQALARQFSQSGSASNGGVLGWLSPSTLEDEVRDTVMSMNKGQVSSLIRTGSGYAILALIDKRVAGETFVGDPLLSIVQVFFPIPPGAPPISQLIEKAAELTAPLKSCPELEDMGRKLNSEQSGRRDGVTLSVMPQNLRSLVTNLPINKASPPVSTGNALMVVMVCSRDENATKGGLPSRDAMRRMIEDERLELLSKRYLRDLRRAAFIDFRL
ncbi:Survival protein SurA precursor (Peptidyl-prolyl cis-trans isomerase SurA) [Paramagnetospirillum magnetotacticum MS-1]|uniref:Parvulin-like PPIase n=1 Tax=Paramagnetospirillum magnetotacticum MS-1 TaxID=272627 RepID=A0A0C2YBM9_PARME|nr:peptidylprolyl isomerase [Paramagnetospirillum magnetotacticum]KIL97114.1 Survival protein SurA precursor (Peptidyl-prolyl cis-trans isomerase SurA) [Paramagnetospirillum magnetotacticum MS-1]